MATIENLITVKRSRICYAKILSRQVQLSLDMAVLTGAFLLAYLLRLDFIVRRHDIIDACIQLPFVVLIQYIALSIAGVYTFIWRYIGIGELKAFLYSALGSSVPLFIFRLSLPDSYQMWRMPLSVIIIDTVLAFGGVLALRVVRRALYEQYGKKQRLVEDRILESKPVLLIGAGRAGVLAAREIQGRSDLGLEIEGFIDDNEQKVGSVIQGVKVLGTSRELPRLVRRLGIDHVVITIAQAARQDIRRIAEICEQIPVKMRIIPGLYELLQGKVEVSRIRDVQIEDLLGREPVNLEERDIKQFVTGRAVMVTGAGGSIGSELARQVARFRPAHLLLVERAEFVLFEIERELRRLWPQLSIIPLVADVGDEARMRSIFSTYQPQVVLHAAAHKHVPMMEANPSEAIKNNVLATHVIGELAGEFAAETFVLISTDKAVNPTSIMGASKRLAELVVQDLNWRYASRYVAVRFGNVLGSAGSVIPIFHEQIRKGGPVTVTHPDMVRYFMTIPEAAQLVLQAGAMGEGSEIFVLDMGEPVRILNLAKEMITLSGLRPFEDIDIVFTGMRPGEKLFEELGTAEERVAKTHHLKIFIGKIAAYPEGKIQQALNHLSVLAKQGKEIELRRYLSELLPEANLAGVDAESLQSPPHELNEAQLGHRHPVPAFLN